MQRTHRITGTRARRGSALVLSLVAVATVVVLAASFTQFASSIANRQAQAVHKKRAFYLAEAGLAEAFSGLSCGKTGIVGSKESPALLGDGVFWVEATEIEPDVIKLESTGMAGTGRAVLSLVVRKGEASVASLGVFSEGLVSVAEGSLVDAYDSSRGSYASQGNHSGAALGSNEDIVLSGSSTLPTRIDGDVTPGPEGALTTSGTVTVTGSTAPALFTTALPAVTVPELTLDGSQVHSSPYPLVIPAGSAGYESLSVLAGAEVIIQGPAVVVLGALALESSAQLTFDTTNGPVDLYVTDALTLASGSVLASSSTRPEDVTIQVPGQTEQPLELRSAGAFHGVVYAPEAQVVVESSFELFGALVASALTFDGAARLHFDKHLAQLSARQALPGMLSWRIVDLGNVSTDLSSDPFDYLGVDKNVLPAPDDAHADQTLAIDYYDFSDVYHRYVGLESQFDWTVVKTVITATRDGEEVVFPRSTTTKTGTAKAPGTVPVIDGPMI